MLQFFLSFEWPRALFIILCLWACVQLIALLSRFRFTTINWMALVLNLISMIGWVLILPLWAFVNIASKEEGTAGPMQEASDLSWIVPPLLAGMVLALCFVVNCIGIARRR